MSSANKPSAKKATSIPKKTNIDGGNVATEKTKKKKKPDSTAKHINRLLRRYGFKSSKAVKRFLRRQISYNIKTARDGCEALAKYCDKSTLTPTICQALVGIRLSAEASNEVFNRVEAAYSAIKGATGEEEVTPETD